jgi:hypothetical protein
MSMCRSLDALSKFGLIPENLVPSNNGAKLWNFCSYTGGVSAVGVGWVRDQSYSTEQML